MPPGRIKQRPAKEEKQCPHCDKLFNVRGFKTHEKACRARQEWAEEPSNVEGPEQGENDDQTQIAEDLYTEVETPRSESAEAGPSTQTINPGDIKIEYHPNSRKSTRILSPEEFKASLSDLSEPTEPPDDEPWLPFRSREDFEFAEIVHDATLNRPQIERLIKLIKRCQEEPGSFTLDNYSDLRNSLESAGKLLTPFKKHAIECEFKGEKKSYESWSRPLWDWVMDHLINPEIVQQFEWDAQKISRYDGEKFSQIYSEPWTGERFWEVQDLLPEGAKPLCLELYADKTQLSSFGTEKGYPVMARILNLPVKIRNGEGIGGARVVGWLPVIKDTEKDRKNPDWVNFKQVIWHESFYKLLETIEHYSVTGYWVECGDGIKRHIFPLILILAADFEEQCVMALTRGVNSLFPCTRCLIPNSEQGDPSATAPLRTTAGTIAVLHEAREQHLLGEKEDILKNAGLRDVDNVFWKINNSDPYTALSFDRLHTLPGGMFRKHLWDQVKILVKEMGRDACVEVDKMAESVPRWRGLNHFSAYLSVDFTDGSKWEDMSKICVLVLRNALGEDQNGYRLLRAIRAYVELDILASFDVHTEETINYGRSMAKKFVKLANEYREGEWNFPKMHQVKHLFDDITAKGVTRNYTSKTFEKMHGPLGDAYERVTNYKDVGGQILRVEHQDLVLKFIRFQLNQFDEFYRKAEKYTVDAETARPSSKTLHTTILGSKQKVLTIEKVLEDNISDTAFTSFLSRVSTTIQRLASQAGDTIAINDSHQIIEYRLIKVKYESLVDWHVKTDYLRCNPKFSGHPRHDFVLVQRQQGCIFAQLVFVFICRVNKKDYHLALIQPLEKKSRTNTSRVDRGLSIHRWNIQARSRCEVIPLNSILRGALLVADVVYKGDYFVIDTLDEDMFLRVKNMS